ncbi:MAG: ABC-2 transporter permease [Oscillospiraceae bacterium]|nr:ABC-2 transporter permease [Oscillospiraceae bacterium]
MKGLLYKDFCVLKKQVKILAVFVVFYAVWSVAAQVPTMMGTMVILLSIMMPISSMSYDEAGQWYRYAFSLPVSRRALVLSKYMLGFLTALGGLLVSAIGNLVILSLTNWENALESWVTIGACLEVGVIFLSVLIPLLFKFGVEKGRFLIVAIAVVPSMLIAMLAGPLKSAGLSLPSEEVLQAVLYASPFFTLAIFLISFRISVGICKKKEY